MNIDKALQANYLPGEPSEFMIYLEALFMTEDVGRTYDLVETYYFDNPALQHSLCDMLARVMRELPHFSTDDKMIELLDTLDCAEYYG